MVGSADFVSGDVSMQTNVEGGRGWELGEWRMDDFPLMSKIPSFSARREKDERRRMWRQRGREGEEMKGKDTLIFLPNSDIGHPNDGEMSLIPSAKS